VVARGRWTWSSVSAAEAVLAGSMIMSQPSGLLIMGVEASRNNLLGTAAVLGRGWIRGVTVFSIATRSGGGGLRISGLTWVGRCWVLFVFAVCFWFFVGSVVATSFA